VEHRLYSACFWTCSDGVVFLVIHFLTLYLYIVKPVLGGHLWDKEKAAL